MGTRKNAIGRRLFISASAAGLVSAPAIVSAQSDWPSRQIRIVNDRAQKAILYFKCGSVMESKFGKEDDAIRYYDAAIKTSPSCLPAVHGLRDLYLRRQDWPRVIQTLELEANTSSEGYTAQFGG